MSFAIDDQVLCDLLPDDGKAAEQRFLALLTSGAETWMIVYAFTLSAMIQDIAAQAARGTKFHIYADRSQEVANKEQGRFAPLLATGNVDITIGTSTAGKAYICHDKAMVNRDGACFVGSCNFSLSGWQQVNAIFEFTDLAYAANLVKQFNTLVNYAWTTEQSFQVMPSMPTAVVLE